MFVVKIFNLCGGERLDEDGHAFFPCGLPDDGHAVNMIEMFDTELEIFPRSSRGPAMEIIQLYNHVDASMVGDQFLGTLNQLFVIVFNQLA